MLKLEPMIPKAVLDREDDISVVMITPRYEGDYFVPHVSRSKVFVNVLVPRDYTDVFDLDYIFEVIGLLILDSDEYYKPIEDCLEAER